MVVNTFSSLGENEDDMDDRRSNVSDDDPKIEGAGELKNLRPEERVPWMERKMHEQSTLVSDLVGCKASEKRVEAERSKLRQYELMRFKEFRRSMIEKIRRRKDTGNKGERRPRVSIESGRCTLRTALKQEASLIMMPAMVKKPSTKDLRAKAFASAQPTNFTRFSIPSLDMKGYYISADSGSLPASWKELNVNAQMSNTMGNTSWRARRGLLRAIAKQPPRNGAKIQLRWLAARVEWMSRAVLIGRCEKPAISLGDEFSRERDDEGEEQLKSSKMVWGIQEDSSAAANSKEQPGTGDIPASATKIWQKVLDTITQIQFKQKILPIPKHGETVVGGYVGLEAGRLSLACMHGEMNAHSWALFHLRRPGIIFTPEAKFSYIDKDEDVIGVALRQKLIIRLGSQDAKRTAPNNPVEMPNMSAENMATVCRVQQNRNTVMRQNASISTSLDYLIGDVLKQIGAASYSEGAPTSSRGQHSVLELFQFPALEAVLVTDQMNECDVVEFDEDERPEVHSTFVCDFLDAVCVQTDFNAQVSFLPELLKSYMQVSDSPLPVENPVKTDKRRYLCEKWAVDPKIRFIDRFRWNPPVIDEVLRKLQIFDHRTTIPKALQRALLDPLDKGVAKALYELLRLVDQRPPLERNNRM
ncbi:hypothetical protein TELCIR_04806 [Teladorsagia circumcincta]|uniref:Bridge-like lipid transfer protein family member 1 C-terminal domain-containing protein n=2 Tax=Teladorsagia circumcincta TaxID=45464 RepID=A0A2G9UU12_TELCI|nr:hypothetical protein TELCIR_04806 [Teladorsagia circumcincta]